MVLVLRELGHTRAVKRNWCAGCRCRCMVTRGRWIESGVGSTSDPVDTLFCTEGVASREHCAYNTLCTVCRRRMSKSYAGHFHLVLCLYITCSKLFSFLFFVFFI